MLLWHTDCDWQQGDTMPFDEPYDLAIVGAGAAGLSAAISGASELPRVALIDSGKKQEPEGHFRQLGGQAIGSTLIENFPGFPLGVSGRELMSLFEEQALRLGAEILCPQRVDSLSLLSNGYKEITTREGLILQAKAVILATGLSYAKLSAPGVAELLGKGVLYGAPTFNPRELGACTICVVGGANSAGQAVMWLSQNPDSQIKLLIRGSKTIDDTMSKYLADRIRACPNIEIVQNAEVVEACGQTALERIIIKRGQTTEELLAQHLFIFIGAVPKTAGWLPAEVKTDPRNYIATGADLGLLYGSRLPYETAMPGVFAAGDGRLGSTKRVASAVGEGAMAVSFVHQYLARL